MIPSASLNPAPQKLTDKGSPAQIDAKTAGAFLDVLNESMQGPEQDLNDSLITIVHSLFQQTNQSDRPVSSEDAEDNELQTRNDLIAPVVSLIEHKVNLEYKVENLPNTTSQQEHFILEKVTELPAEASAPTKESLQPPVEEDAQPAFSLRKSDLDPRGQFEGKEIIFQSIHPNTNAAPAAKKDQIQAQRVSVDQLFSEVVDVVKNQASIKKAVEFVEAKFSLTPEKLGDIDVKLSIHKGQVTAQFTADTLMGKESLESQISSLRSALTQQGLQVDKIEISLSGQGLQHSFSQQEGKSRQDQSQQRFAKKKISVDEFYQSHTVTEEYKQRGTENTINILA